MTEKGPIGLFDSGLGGLTVVRALIDLVPSESLIYFGDTGRFPYGPKPPGEVREYAQQIGDLLVERGVRAVVVACNSAAAAALNDLQTRLPVPVIGVIEPGVKAALAATKTGRVGVIGTEGTIASHAYTKTAAALSPKVEIFAQSCPGFVEFVEAGDVDSPELYQLAQEHLAPIKAANVDVLVLGCTHYPLLASTLSSVMGPQVAVISSAQATARAISAIELRSGSNSAPTHHFITSGDPNTFHALATRFLGSEINDVEEHSWS